MLFMGTPSIAVPTLEALVRDGFEVVTVVTRPDKPASRGLRLTPPPVKVAAQRLGLPFFQPEKVNSPESVGQMKAARPDVLLVVAFGRILRSECLSLAPLGAINAHPSLLPLYRGPAPIQHALLNGDRETGVTTLYMDERMDAGDIILQKRVPIYEDDDAGSLTERLAQETASVVVETLRLVKEGKAPRIPQDETQATYAPILPASLSRIDWSQPAQTIGNVIRALTPDPGAFSVFRGKRVRFWKVRPVPTDQSFQPGTVHSVSPSGFLIAAGEGSVMPILLQTEGRRVLPVEEWLRGTWVSIGETFQ